MNHHHLKTSWTLVPNFVVSFLIQVPPAEISGPKRKRESLPSSHFSDAISHSIEVLHIYLHLP